MISATGNTRLVVTGFGPFGEHEYNPSWDAARVVGDELDVDAHLLSVTFNAAAQFAGAHLRAAAPRPLLFVHFGLGATRRNICFERCAQNERDDTPDRIEKTHCSRLPSRQELVAESRRQRFSRLDIAELVDRYGARDLPSARISEDCGSFVCNALLYHSLRACENARSAGQMADALFIHVPPMESSRAEKLGRHLAKEVLTPLPDLL